MIAPILAHEGPEIQSVTLADLLATYIAGHAPVLRETILKMHFELVLDLIPINEHAMFGDDGHPAGRM